MWEIISTSASADPTKLEFSHKWAWKTWKVNTIHFFFNLQACRSRNSHRPKRARRKNFFLQTSILAEIRKRLSTLQLRHESMKHLKKIISHVPAGTVMISQSLKLLILESLHNTFFRAPRIHQAAAAALTVKIAGAQFELN